jgi:hypothetical protein
MLAYNKRAAKEEKSKDKGKNDQLHRKNTQLYRSSKRKGDYRILSKWNKLETIIDYENGTL